MRRFKEPAVISATRYAIALLMLLTAAPATTYAAAADAATNYPTHPIRFILGYPPGGASDAVARQLAFSLGARMGQNIVLDNRGGAGGNIAAELAARAAPDGYTWFLGNNGILATNQALYESCRSTRSRTSRPSRSLAPSRAYSSSILLSRQPRCAS